MHATTTGRQEADMLAYGYKCDGLNDEGWGCVYRSVQNVQHFLGLPVTPMTHLLQLLGVGERDKAWSEPGQYARLPIFDPRAVQIQALVVGRPGARCFQHSSRDDYEDATAMTLADLLSRDKALIQRGRVAYAIDDGVSGYALVPGPGPAAGPAARRELLFVDPHYTPARVMHVAEAAPTVGRPSGWMVLRAQLRGR